MNHPGDVSIRRFQESDLDQLVRLISETIEISYAEVYPPRAVQFFKEFRSEKKIADRSKTGKTLVVEGGWGTGGYWQSGRWRNTSRVRSSKIRGKTLMK